MEEQSHVEKLKLKSFRFKTEQEIERDKALAKMRDEDPEKVRTTEDVEVWARPTRLSNNHRVVEFASDSPVFVLHSRDLKTILETQEFDVMDLKVRKKD